MRRRLPLALAMLFCAVLLVPSLASGGRAAGVIAALAGAGALAWLLARLVDRRAAAYGVVALATMPLFFVQVRAELADVIAAAGDTLAFAGLGVAVLDRRRGGGIVPRVVSLGLGVAGLAIGGFARGALLGVAVPALGVGLAWLLLGVRRERFADACGALSLLAGLVCAVIGVPAGVTTAGHATFDAVVHRLGHALFPWSALLPFTLLALLSSSPRHGALASARDGAARVVVLTGSVLALGAHAIAAGRPAPAVFAAALAIAARDLDRRGSAAMRAGLRDPFAARAAGIAAAVLTALLARDLLDVPERALAPLVPIRAGAVLATGGTWLRASAIVFAAAVALVSFDRTRPSYLAWPRALARAWGGQLLTVLVAVEAAFVSTALVLALRPSRAHEIGAVPRLVVQHAVWALPLAIFAVVWIPLAARDALLALRRRARLSRGATVMGAGALAGALLCARHYPALLAQLSPHEALSRYAALHGPGEPLGVLGPSLRAMATEARSDVRAFDDAAAAQAFLSGGATRRWLVLRRDDLPPLNALFRRHQARNVPVLAGGEGDILLVASAPVDGVPSAAGPLDDLVLSTAPSIAHPIEAALGDGLLTLGWDLRLGTEARDALVPLRTHRLRLYYRVTGRLDDGFCSFVHIDGQGRRFNAEHRDFRRYPLRHWQPGDVIVDEFEVTLGANFTPGDYALRYGFDRLPCDGRGRLAVTRGPHDGDRRVDGGTIHVR